MSRKKRVPGVSLLLMGSREVGAAEFKARCLELIDEVDRTKTELLVTRHRKPVARIVPVVQERQPFCGSLKDMVISCGDLMSPIDVEWEADESNFT